MGREYCSGAGSSYSIGNLHPTLCPIVHPITYPTTHYAILAHRSYSNMFHAIEFRGQSLPLSLHYPKKNHPQIEKGNASTKCPVGTLTLVGKQLVTRHGSSREDPGPLTREKASRP